jgi:hypothetical protein
MGKHEGKFFLQISMFLKAFHGILDCTSFPITMEKWKNVPLILTANNFLIFFWNCHAQMLLWTTKCVLLFTYLTNLLIYNLTKSVTEVLGSGGKERRVSPSAPPKLLVCWGPETQISSVRPSVEVLKSKSRLFVRLSRSWNPDHVCLFVCRGPETQISSVRPFVEVLKPRSRLSVCLSRSWNLDLVCPSVYRGPETQIPSIRPSVKVLKPKSQLIS